MDINKAIEYMNLALNELKNPINTNIIDTPARFDTAFAVANPGDVLELSPILVYPTMLTIAKPITLKYSAIPSARMNSTIPLPSFRGGIRSFAKDVWLKGIEAKHTDPFTDIVTFAGMNTTIDRCRILGDSIKGAKRGIAANGDGNCDINQCYIDDIFQPSPGSDAQAICAWDMGAGLIISDNYLCAGSETIMLGGSDSQSQLRMPTNVIIDRNTITANMNWIGKAIGVKTRLELKACRKVTITNNVISNVWKQGQEGYLVSLTVRNQNGAALWSTIEDVTIDQNIMEVGCSAFNILARDDEKPSGTMRGVKITNNIIRKLDPIALQNGSNKMIQIGRGPVDLTIDSNQFEGINIGSQVYFYGAEKCTNLKVTNNKWPKSTYGVFGDNASVGLAWNQYVASGVLGGNIEV